MHFRDVFKTSSRRLQDVSFSHTVPVNTSSVLALDMFSTFFRCTAKTIYLQKDLPRSHLWEMYRQGTNFPRVNPVELSKQFKTVFLKYFIK